MNEDADAESYEELFITREWLRGELEIAEKAISKTMYPTKAQVNFYLEIKGRFASVCREYDRFCENRGLEGL